MRQDLVDLAVSVAAEKGIDAALLCTVMQVESGGTPTWADGKPVILFEKHQVFSRLTARIKTGDRSAVAILAAARAAGLATPKWGGYADQPNQAAREGLLSAMALIDRATAYECVSMGCGQVMGFNHDAVGYASAEAMYGAFGDPRAQVDAIYAFLDSKGILPFMKAHDWAHVAERYNGEGYRRNDYDRHLADAYALWSVKFRSGQTQPPAEGLGLGSSGDAVLAIQKELVATGYPCRTDGRFGPATMAAVAAFQAHHGIEPGKGIVDQATADTLFAKPPIPHGSRELATRASLAKTSRIVALARRAKGVHLAGFGGTGAVVGLANLDSIQAGVSKLQQARDLYGSVHNLVTDTGAALLHWAVSNPLVASAVGAMALVTFVVTRMLGGIEDARVDDEKSGATT